MDLKGELARQSFLLEFIAECAGLTQVSELAKLLTSRLQWIADYDACTALLPEKNGLALRVVNHRHSGGPSDLEPALLKAHRELLEKASAACAPTMSKMDQDGIHLVALPFGNGTRAHGSLCVSRTSAKFLHGDVRHLQHACGAVGLALDRIDTTLSERLAVRGAEQAQTALRTAAEDRALLAEQMIGIVSHDLRNPLSAILMGSTLMAHGDGLSTQQTRTLTKVGNAARRAQRLVEELLDFTQARVGKGLILKRRTVNMDAVVDECVDELKLSFPAMDLRYEATQLGEVSADPDRIHQVLGNLVSNAVSYGTPARPIRLTASVIEGEVSIAVSNEGGHLAEDVRRSLFEPMVRGSSVGSAERSVGLGLYIVKAIAEAHGGDVEVFSPSEGPITFEVKFPATLENKAGHSAD